MSKNKKNQAIWNIRVSKNISSNFQKAGSSIIIDKRQIPKIILAKYKKTPHLYFKKSFFKFLKKNNLNYKILKMPKSFYDSQFGRFAVLIKL